MPTIELRADIKEAARSAFSSIQSRIPDETFYAFALYAYIADGFMIRAAANTEEQHHCKQSEDMYLRWCTNEWAYYDLGEDFDRLDDDRLADPISDAVPGASDTAAEADDNDDQLQAEIYAAMVLALGDLKSEGYFGERMKSGEITLLCDTWKRPAERAWLLPESVRLLNPPPVFEKFAADWKAGQEPENETPACRLFERFISRAP